MSGRRRPPYFRSGVRGYTRRALKPSNLIARFSPDEVPADRQRHRFRVGLIEDEVGAVIAVPVVAIRSPRPGPVVGLTSALHGNEINGIAVIHRLMNALEGKLRRGCVVGVLVANVPGFRLAQRTYSDGTDLNYIMPGRPDGSTAELYAHRLVENVVRQFDVLFDLHTASVGRENCLYVRADLDDPRIYDIARRLRPDIVLDNPARDGSLRGCAGDFGILALTVEIANPQRFQLRYIRDAAVGIRAVLADLGMVGSVSIAERPPPVICSDSRWFYTDRGGLLTKVPGLLERVAEGQPMGTLLDVYGDPVRVYRAPYAGIVIGRSVNPVASAGARIVHLGKIRTDRPDPRP